MQTVLKVLDNFVQEVDCDESMESWHPKVAFIRQSRDMDQAHCWRFWMGSRNFTRDRSWDAGLLLVGTVEENGKSVPGLIETAKELWSRARFRQFDQRAMADELSRVRWIHPPGCKVEEIEFLLPRTKGRGLPAEPRRLESLLVVSPFLDGGAVKELGKWGNSETDRTLLSTQRALSGLAAQKSSPLIPFNSLLHMSDFDEDESLFMNWADESFEEAPDEVEEEHTGLHAKLILARRKGQATLWLGSPNATKRAWEKNYEIVARLSVHEELAEALTQFAKKAQIFDIGELKPEPISQEREAIEEAHKQVVSRWQVRQKNWTLYSDALPHPDNPKVLLEVGILGAELVKWPNKIKILPLPQGEPPIETELVQVRVSLGESERRWLQKAPLEPPPGVDRDRRAVATMLSPRIFLKWLRAILDDLPTGGGTWDRRGTNPTGQSSPERWVPALEDILKAWTRNPGVLKVVDARMKAYMEFIRASSGDESKEMRLLDEFEKMWKIVRQELREEE
ncbi:MAG: phospholipase D family protein [Syntrophales bacterium]